MKKGKEKTIVMTTEPHSFMVQGTPAMTDYRTRKYLRPWKTGGNRQSKNKEL